MRKWGKLCYLQTNCDQNQKDIDLAKSEITVGRRKHSDVWVKHPQASGQHAIISKTACGSVLIQDLSQNGTFVNNRRLAFKEKVELKQGDKLQFLEDQPNKKLGKCGIDC